MSSNGDRAFGSSLTDAAYSSIRRAIITCDLTPGEQVSETGLADRFGFGRAAVRSALTRLNHEQLVQALPRRGYAIAPITIKHVHDLFGVRLIIEPAVARLASQRTDSHFVSELEQLNHSYAQAIESSSMTVLRQANTDFHMAVARASGNDRLAELLEGILDEIERVLYLPQLTSVGERTVSSVSEHQRIIAALATRDEHEAECAAADHILPNQQAVIDGLIASPQLRSINLVREPDTW